MLKKASTPLKIAKPTQPHDRCFRKVMGKSKIALKFLRSYIPAHIINQIDPKSLKLADGTFLNDEHREQRTDLLYKANLKFKKEGKASVCYFHLEQESSVYPLMPIRVHRYVLSIIERDWEENHRQWPTVYTVVLYNGKKRYTAEPNFFKNFEFPFMAKEAFENSFFLVDLNKIDDSILKQESSLGLFELFLKHGNTKKPVEFLRSIGDIVSKVQSTDFDILQACAQYLFETNKDALSRQQILEEIQTHLTPKNRKIIMTIAQAFKEEGRQEEVKKFQSFFSDLLKGRFHRGVTAKYLKMINSADSSTLSLWGKKLLNAKSIEDVFHQSS